MTASACITFTTARKQSIRLKKKILYHYPETMEHKSATDWHCDMASLTRQQLKATAAGSVLQTI